MNRIERVLWEETQLAMIQRVRGDSLGRGAKVVAIVALAGAVALLATGVSIPRPDDVVVQALTPASIVYAPYPASDARRAINAQSYDPADKDGP